MMRAFTLILAAGLLCLPVSPASGSIVDHSSPNIVAHTISGDSGQDGWVLLADGTVWALIGGGNMGGYYQRVAIYDPPVPIDQIKFWAQESLVTTDGRSLVLTGTETGPTWVDLGPAPVGPVSSPEQNAGSLKSQYRAPQQSGEHK